MKIESNIIYFFLVAGITFCISACQPPELDKNIGMFCILTNNCGVWKRGDHQSVGRCVETIEIEKAEGKIYYDEETIDCVIAAGRDCSKVYECMNDGYPAEDCEGTNFQDRCEGELAISCSERGLVSHDRCDEYREKLSLPFEYSCILDARYARCEPPACQEDYSICSNGYHVWCEDAELLAEHCETIYGSAECKEQNKGAALCIGKGPQCREEDEITCDGTELVYCLHGREARYDCSVIGEEYTCRTVGGKAKCAGRGNQCMVDDEKEKGGDSCTGPVLNYCHAGYLLHVNCRALGFDTCAWRPDKEVAWCR